VAGVRGVGVVIVALASALAAGQLTACQSSSRPAARPAPTSIAPTTTASTPSTTSGAQTTGPRTVLSAVGLNIRAQASKSAAIRGTAAQGVVLTVLAHTDQGGGWFEVKGSTVTGWITDNPTLSAAGKFISYASTALLIGALYPDTWTVTESPPASVVFRPQSSVVTTVVVTTASTVAQLGRGRAGYRQTNDQQVVVCGITGDLLTYMQAGTPSTATVPPAGVAAARYLTQVHIAIDPQHAIGIDANFADPSQLQTVRDIVSSITFPSPKCQR
jgi:hypothetical protein